MLQQESLSDKGLFAVGAFVWFDASMTHFVPHPVGEVSESFFAVAAGELFLAIMNSHMVPQMQLRFEHFCTDLTLELRIFHVIGHMSLEATFLSE